MPIRQILVPVDYSDCSRAALALAGVLAKTLGATLAVVNVWDRPLHVDDIRVQQLSGPSRPLADMIRENAELQMASFMKERRFPEGVSFTSRLLAGNPAAAILAELGAGQHELLVIGTHGRTGFRHLLLGSVAEKLVRLSPVPVLTVPGAR